MSTEKNSINKSKKKTKLVVIILGTVVVLVAALAGLWFSGILQPKKEVTYLSAEQKPINYARADRNEEEDVLYATLTEEKLFEMAENVVIVQVNDEIDKREVKNKTSIDGGIEEAITLSSCTVIKTFKGELTANANILVSEPYGIKVLGESRLCNIYSKFYTPFEKDAQYVLFLNYDSEDACYTISNKEYGKYNLNVTDAKENSFTQQDEKFNELKEIIVNKYR